MKNKTRTRGFTTEECVEKLVSVSHKLRHIPSQAEVKSLAKNGDFPDWGTLHRMLGPWYTWRRLFENKKLRFHNDQAQIAAGNLEKNYLEEEAYRQAAQRRFEAKVASGEIAPSRDTKDIVEQVTGMTREEIDKTLQEVSAADSMISQEEINSLTRALNDR